ncbi:phage tail protein [Paracoccus sp. Z330]|uniref:Phage tail protein n=1 Tax=Paracoccus onchidii TaxID=3017813 RepID=A0ABT4ZDR9_9RHOB|nr:phage tail protein [Paracoccus onchidii]MDB6177128.1 phage tail protein [Paracoccus onchidii]
MEPLIGQIIMFAGSFAPRGWAVCDGRLLSIERYPQLFSLIGTMHGGDGQNTFGLPDLRHPDPDRGSRTATGAPLALGAGNGRGDCRFIIAVEGSYPDRD